MIFPVRRADSVSTIPVPGVGYYTFLGLVWTGAALSLLSVLLRLYARIRGPGRLYLDDVFIVVAEAMVLTTAGLWQWAAKFMYYILNVESGGLMPGPEILDYLRRWLDVQLISELFFYTTLLLVKLSFLFFFRRLGQNVQGQKRIWWPALAFSWIAYVVSVGDVQYKCYVSSLDVVAVYCTTEEANDFTMATLRANMALDVFSDFLIMLIPILMLWNVRLPTAKKLAFMGLFSLSIITMVVAIVRAVNVNSSRDGGGQDDATFLWLWSTIQASLAVVIACLSAFPQLFSGSAKKKPVWTPTDTYYQRLSARMRSSKNKSVDVSYDLTGPATSGVTEPKPASFRETSIGSDSSVGLGRDTDAASYGSGRPWFAPGAKQ